MEGIQASVIILSQVFCEVRLEAQKFQLSKLWPLTCLKRSSVQFTIIKDKIKQENFTFEKLTPEK